MLVQRCPMLPVVVLFGLGVLAQGRMFAYFEIIAVGLWVVIGSIFFCRRRRKIFIGLFYLAWFLLGFVYTHGYSRFRPDHIYFAREQYLNQIIEVEGVVVSDPRRKDLLHGPRTSFEMDLRAVRDAAGVKQYSGRLLVNIYQPRSLDYGDVVVLSGKLHRPYDFSPTNKFSYKKYLSRKGIVFVLSVKKDADVRTVDTDQAKAMSGMAIQSRHRLAGVIDRYLPAGAAGFIRALVLGDRTDLPAQVQQLFVHTGTAHIIAISGFNVGIVVGMLLFAGGLAPVPRWIRYGMTIILLAGYTILTGASPSVVRASLMASIFLMSLLFERETDGINTLSLAALLILLAHPFTLFDIGFQLSFISVAAIIVLYPLFWQRWGEPFQASDPPWLVYGRKAFFVSLAAWAGSAGLVLYHFEIFTPVSLLANLLVVPISAALVVLGLGLLAAAYIFPPAACAVAACIWLLFNGMGWIVYYLEKIPGAYLYWSEVSWVPVAVYYTLVVIFWLRFRQRPGFPQAWIDKETQLC